MRVGGLQKFSLIDYPGKVAAVIFTQGCNFRCPFCHNPELVFPEKFKTAYLTEEIFTFLERRKNKLEGVVVTGGEPTIHPDLENFIGRIKEIGFAVKLDTNGTNPGMLRHLIAEQMIDFVAMDVKAPLHKYEKLCGTLCDKAAIRQSIEIIISSGIDHEFRTTVVKPLLNPHDLAEITMLLKGSNNYRLQNFSYNGKLIDLSLADQPCYEEENLVRLQLMLNSMINLDYDGPVDLSDLFDDPTQEFTASDDFIFEN